MKNNNIVCTLIPGDGVGPELVASAESVLKFTTNSVTPIMLLSLRSVDQADGHGSAQDARRYCQHCPKDSDSISDFFNKPGLKSDFLAMKVPMEFELLDFSENSITGPKLTREEVVESINRNKICLKGTLESPPMGSPVFQDKHHLLNTDLRQRLDMFANVVHVRSLLGIPLRHKSVNLVIVREQTEGEYSGLEHEAVPGVVECLKISTRRNATRIAKFAFDYAIKFHRKKVTCIHKANIMKLGDGLFLETCRNVSKMYPKIEFDDMIVDNCTMQIVWKPQQFDVLVTPNLYGNLLENIGAGLVGGAGVVPGVNYSAKCAVFEPGARHTFARGRGKNIANPIAILFCLSKLFHHIHRTKDAILLRNSVDRTIGIRKIYTQDLGGTATTTEFTQAVIDTINDL